MKTLWTITLILLAIYCGGVLLLNGGQVPVCLDPFGLSDHPACYQMRPFWHVLIGSFSFGVLLGVVIEWIARPEKKAEKSGGDSRTDKERDIDKMLGIEK